MFKLFSLIAWIAALATMALAADSTEVLYVAQPANANFSLLTFDVDPTTATATQVGTSITVVGAPSIR